MSDPNKKTANPVREDDTTRIKDNLGTGDTTVTPQAIPPPPSDTVTYRCEHDTPPWKKKLEFTGIGVAIFLLIVNTFQMCATKKSADAARDGVKLQASYQRPWVKINVAIVQPLTFNVPTVKGPVASMGIRESLENVGQSVALHVYPWAELIPLDANGYATARSRQHQWCDANRRHKQSLSGYMLFPRDPFAQVMSVGTPMDTIYRAAQANPGSLKGKVGFVLVGCVVYRSSVEDERTPAHETGFMYWLAEPQANGGVQPYVSPSGTDSKLELVTIPDGFWAD